MWKSFRLISSNPKRIKCIFIGHPKQLGIPPNSDPKAIGIVSWIRSFLEEKFLSKELSGRMVETWWGCWTITSTSVGATGTTSCGLLHTNWSDGSIISSSLHHPPTQFFWEKLFLEKGPVQETIPIAFGYELGGIPNCFGCPMKMHFIRFGFELINLKLFHISVAAPNL